MYYKSMTVVIYISKDLVDADKSFLEFLNDGERLLLLAIEQMNKSNWQSNRTTV